MVFYLSQVPCNQFFLKHVAFHIMVLVCLSASFAWQSEKSMCIHCQITDDSNIVSYTQLYVHLRP